MNEYYRNDICSLLLWHLERAGRNFGKGDPETFEESFRKSLKFDKQTDWKKYRACIDLFEDAEYAILSAYMFQLGELKNKNGDFGEKYVRLYGILNAVYLQISSIVGLAKLLKYPNPKNVEKEFKSLSVFHFRNVAGSHTVNFEWSKEQMAENDISNSKTSFRIVQVNWTKFGDRMTAIDENGVTLQFDLLEILDEYLAFSNECLINIINHSVDFLVLKKKDKERMRERLMELINGQIDYRSLNKNQGYLEKSLNKYQKFKKGKPRE